MEKFKELSIEEMQEVEGVLFLVLYYLQKQLLILWQELQMFIAINLIIIGLKYDMKNKYHNHERAIKTRVN
ncbi:bacteriocin-type signal sequence-containing protein [Algoriphagus boritolerans DSM 17298 = JCM 18970]|uniref:Bacteriocin-type signal sequence-containing protein n=1 Tax=Algoriphagus boritolerans DSM 17298 = JCM 18970 TaxID=1120964 RepID=A0A1H5VX79_9BACT|nr:bacteriocin-type signal sequence-containing protein [Algoriphagus boritolerans DSM 17298 = JCM 18970]